MARLWRRRGVSAEQVRETVPSFTEARTGPVIAAPAAVGRRGLDSDIPMGGTTTRQQSTHDSQGRSELMDQLYGAYLACPWSNRCVDTIATTVTAGGIEIVPDGDDTTKLAKKPAQPKPVADLQRLVDFVNPHEDIVQLMRGVHADQLVFGDSFTEVVWFLGQPVALYSLDCATMTPIADEHGVITSYVQTVGAGREVTFAPHEVIQVSQDNLRGGVYGVSPTQKMLLPITNWLFTEGLLKETMRKGNPARLVMDWPTGTERGELERTREEYQVRQLGIPNVGNLITTRGGAHPIELKPSAIAEYLATLDKERDVITSGYGVPNRKIGIAEAGSLGGAGAEVGEDRTFELNTCQPEASLTWEKWNFLLLQGFGISGWRLRYGSVDWRSDDVASQMADRRVRNGTWSINRAREEIDEPPVPGGDVPVLVDRQNLIAIPDLPAYSKAGVEALKAKGAQPTADPAVEGEEGDDPAPANGDEPAGTAPDPSTRSGGKKAAKPNEAFEARFAAALAAAQRAIVEDARDDQ